MQNVLKRQFFFKMFHEIFPSSVQFWKTTLISKIIFITNLIRVDLYLVSAVEL